MLSSAVSARSLAALAKAEGVHWEETPPFFRYGTYVKKEEYTKPAVNPKTQERVLARRPRGTRRADGNPPGPSPRFALR